MTDRNLSDLLRAAFSPTDGQGPGPSRDLWPLVVDRINARHRFSRLDVGIAAVVAILLLLLPKAALLLAYHL